MNGGDVIINGGNSGASGIGGCVTITGGVDNGGFGHGGYGDWMQYYDEDTLAKMNAGQPRDEKALIKNNPCWPYTTPNKPKVSDFKFVDISLVEVTTDLDISGPTVEEHLASLEAVENYELKIIGGGEITFAEDCVTKDYIDSMYNSELEDTKDKVNHLMNENVVLTNTVRDLESRLSFLETSQPWKDFV